MKIKLKGRNALVASGNERGQFVLVALDDFAGKINFRNVIRRYLKEQDNFITTRVVEPGSHLFLASMERPLTAMDILKIALRVERR